MSNFIIACEMLKDEVLKSQENTGNKDPIKWMDSILHMDPDKLRADLQNVIDDCTGYDNLLFVYGSCGNGLVGLKATTARLIVPKTADCITMLLYGRNDIDDIRKDTYFLTKGWLEGEKNLRNEYQHSVDKYGEEKARHIFKVMLNHYRYLMLIDSSAYDIDEYIKISEELAVKLELEFKIKTGNVTMMDKLLQGQWDEDFCVVPKGSELSFSAFGSSSSDTILNKF